MAEPSPDPAVAGDAPLGVRLDPSTLYSREDLRRLLAPLGLDVDTFIAKTRPARRFRAAYWGADLIAAIGAAPLLPERLPPELPAPRARGGRRRSSPASGPLDRILEDARRSA